MLQTEFEFTLPCGYIDERGALQRHGVMRRATALDEVEALGDPHVQNNEAYLSIVLLSRVIMRVGTIEKIDRAVVERLFATDFVFLQQLYAEVNGTDAGRIVTRCPDCGARVELELAGGAQ